MAFPLTRDQKRAVTESGGPLLVSAAAGAGKTRVLVERLLDRVCAGANVSDFLVITFTNAAAAELRDRVAGELSERVAREPTNRHLRRQITLVYEAHISTIHAFCGDVLRHWGHLLDVDPDFRLADEGEQAVLKAEALNDLMEERYRTAGEDPTFGLLLDTFSAGRDDSALLSMVLEIFEKLESHPDPEGWLQDQQTLLTNLNMTDLTETLWGDFLLTRARRRAAYWWGKLSPLYDACETGVAAYRPSLAVTLGDLSRLANTERWDRAEAVDFPRLASSAKCKDPELAARTKALRERCKKDMARVCDPLTRKTADLLRDLRDMAPAAKALLTLVGDFSKAFAAWKGKRNVLDFNDLEHKTLALLTDHPDAADVIRGQFREVMVDEYQDTNRVQDAIFHALTRETGNLFLVGDVKQAIYRFRLADPTLFVEKYRSWLPAGEAAPGEGRRVTLGENFRSRREVIDGVNFLFRNLMSRELGELDYGEEEALQCRGDYPDGPDDRIELCILEVPDADEGGREPMAEPRFIARRLAGLVADGFQVSDGAGGLRPVRPSDMVILLRSPNRVLNHYARALREVGLPWASEGSEDFFDEPETSVALSFLEIIDNPRQDVPLIAVLRSPVYGFTPDRLAALREKKGDGECYYDALLADEGEDAKAFLRELEDLRIRGWDLRSYEILWEVYRRTGLLDVYAAMEGGESRREHLMALYGYARRFEGAGHKGLFGFLHHLRRRREQGESLTTPGGGGEGVRILSIHRSKGLEFPVVALGGLGKRFNRKDTQGPMLFHQTLGLGPKGMDKARGIQYPTAARWAVAAKLDEENLSEELRLLYVAMTRAREKLIMTIGLENPQSTLEKLAEDAGLPVDPQALLAQPTVGHWILSAALCRPEAASLRPLGWKSRGRDRWGAPWRIGLVSGEPFRQPPPVVGEVTGFGEEDRGDAVLPDYSWRYPYGAVPDIPSKLTATQLKGREMDAEVAEDAPAAAAPKTMLFDRPDFALTEKGLTAGERGTAHHLVMQYLDYSRAGSPAEIEREIAGLVDRAVITPQQGAAVDPRVLFAFFDAPLGREAMAADLHREFKFSVLEEAARYYPGAPAGEQVLLQGVVDCWYETEEGVVVIDFKSDRVTEATVAQRAADYKPQLDAYSRALSLMLNKPVVKRALWFFSLGREVDI